jgi:GNAT superfamily N-acetyltransferase
MTDDVHAAGSVRPARPSDAGVIGRIQLTAWREQYAELLPAEALEAASPADLAATWHAAITEPPTPRHRVVVAVEGSQQTDAGAPSMDLSNAARVSALTDQDAEATALDRRRVTGFAAFGPAEDPDCDPETTAEIFALTVAPSETGHGHGSRLLAACADLSRDAGFTLAVCWTLLDDTRFRSFLQETGWTPDGAYRDLDRGDGGPLTRSVRLQAAL